MYEFKNNLTRVKKVSLQLLFVNATIMTGFHKIIYSKHH